MRENPLEFEKKKIQTIQEIDRQIQEWISISMPNLEHWIFDLILMADKNIMDFKEIKKYANKFQSEGYKELSENLWDLWAKRHCEYGVKKSGASPYKPSDYKKIQEDFKKINKK